MYVRQGDSFPSLHKNFNLWSKSIVSQLLKSNSWLRNEFVWFSVGGFDQQIFFSLLCSFFLLFLKLKQQAKKKCQEDQEKTKEDIISNVNFVKCFIK